MYMLFFVVVNRYFVISVSWLLCVNEMRFPYGCSDHQLQRVQLLCWCDVKGTWSIIQGIHWCEVGFVVWAVVGTL